MSNTRFSRWSAYVFSQIVLVAAVGAARAFPTAVWDRKVDGAFFSACVFAACVAAWAYTVYIAVHRR